MRNTRQWFLLSSPITSRIAVRLSSNSTSIATALQKHIESPTPLQGQAIHSYILKTGLQPNMNLAIKLLILHIKCGCLAYARNVFDEMPSPKLSAYNFLIAGYFKEGLTEDPFELIRKLAWSGEKPDGFTLSMALKLSSNCCSLSIAMQVHTQMVKLICYPDDILFAALIDSYAKNDKMSYAKRVFELMPDKNLVCSTALIVGYMNQSSFTDAEDIFEKLVDKDTVVFNAMIEGYSRTSKTSIQSLEVYKVMRCLSFCPSVSTFVSVVGACSLLSDIEFGKQVHCEIVKTGAFSHVKSGSALIDMYCKCGRIEDARIIFDCMPQKNVISWSALIDGYGKNGSPKEALELFVKMQREKNVRPNYATFLSVLSACRHAGLISEGKIIFESMERDYMLKPRMDHYACMVDLLGRTGSLDEAYSFIKNIPEKPNSDVWTALLAAARLHEDVKMADIAANEIFELSGNRRPGAYVALSNTFAAAGKWNGVSEVRDLMIERGVSRNAGCSWVGIE